MTASTLESQAFLHYPFRCYVVQNLEEYMPLTSNLRRKLEETTDTKRRRKLIAKIRKVSPHAEVPEK
jgi:hypothetical protein